MKITAAQLNPVIGDITGNLEKVETTLKYCKGKSDLVVFPELFITGYPPRDLLQKSWFMERVMTAIDEIKSISVQYLDTGILIGAPYPTGKRIGRGLYNSALLFNNGKLLFRQDKTLLPTYDVFDEARYFDTAEETSTIMFKGEKLGISICEDMWNVKDLWAGQRYDINPLDRLGGEGATLLINISASPFNMGKDETRFNIIKNHVLKYNIPFVFVNQVGANDELIFDGTSLVVNAEKKAVVSLPSFQEEVMTIDLANFSDEGYKPLANIESVYHALLLGIKDYVHKCGFEKVVLGLSGGIDSAVTCCLARYALGRENVLAVTMPGPYSSRGSIEDSRKLAGNLGIELKEVPIARVYDSYLASLNEMFTGTTEGVAEENIQARIRGNIVMAISNKFGHLVLTTGNKSELAVGYCTLYGDMSGGLSVISDVPKTLVYEVAAYINREEIIIPQEIISKPPSAELKPDQKDEDTLPPYEILDKILYYYIDEGYSRQDIVARGMDDDLVGKVIKLVDRNEYKRRQAAPGLKVTTKAFGVGRRMPIAARYNRD